MTTHTLPSSTDDAPMNITARIKPSPGDGPFGFYGPDDSTPFTLPGRTGLGMGDFQVLSVNFQVGLRKVMGQEQFAALRKLEPSVAWFEALNEAYSAHLEPAKEARR